MSRELERRSLFKKQDFDSGRRRREETVIQIRKNKKEEQLMKRRQSVTTPSVEEKEIDNDSSNFRDEDIPQLVHIIAQGKASGNQELLKAVRGIRKLLSVEENPPVEPILQHGALPYLVELLTHYEDQDIMFEASWAITNIASTDRTKDVVLAGAAPILSKLLFFEKACIREQAAWCLGNIAGDCVQFRNTVLELKVLDGLILNMNEPETSSLLANVTWTVSNLCRGKPLPPLEYIEPAIAPIASLLRRQHVSDDVLVDAVWALSYMSDGDNDRIQKVMDTGITKELVGMLQKSNTSVLTPSLRTMGNFVTGSDQQTQEVVDAGVVQYLFPLLDHPNRNIRKETCWLLSNIAAGTTVQLDYLFKHEGLVEKIVRIAVEDRWEVKKEALWTLSNICTQGAEFHVRILVQKDGLLPITENLGCHEPSVIKICLEALEKVLEVGQKNNLNYPHIVDEYGGIEKLEELQTHDNEEVYESTVGILERYFGVEDEDYDENIAPAEEGGMFGFGMSKRLFPDNEGASSSEKLVLGQSQNFDFGGSSMDTSMQH